MQTVVLAAGEGTRIRPLSASVPKPMLPVANRPLVGHAAAAAAAAGADELVLVVGYRAETVREHFGSEIAGVPVEYAVQGEQSGTADAVRAARPHLDDDAFAVLNGDNLYDPDALAELFANGPAIGSVRVDDPRNYGVLSTDGDRVTDVVEKPSEPPSDLANAGAYTFPSEARDWLDVERSARGEYELTDVLARLIDDDRYELSYAEFDRWLDVGRPWELLEANEWKLDELDRYVDEGSEVSEDAQLSGSVVVEAGAEIRSGVVVEGPALIRSGATVGPNAYVRGATLLAEGAKVGHGVEVKNSVLMAGATVGHLSYVGDSILGPDVNLGAGTITANLRHDGEPVEQTVKGERVSTERRKFGAVVGEGVKTGIHTSLNPGVVLGPHTTTAPNDTVERDRGHE